MAKGKREPKKLARDVDEDEKSKNQHGFVRDKHKQFDCMFDYNTSLEAYWD